MPKRNGIDVSRYQALVDWGKVAGSGVVWAATKATQGTKYADATLARNRAGMASAQIRHRLFYHWLNPAPLVLRLSAKARVADARKQAAHFLATVGPLSAGEGVMLDAEQDGITADAVLAWCEAVEAKTGRPVAVYTGVYVAKGSIWQSRSIFNGRRPRVLAAYTTEQRARTIATPYRWDVWQWTGSGRMPGVGPEVDIDQVDNPAIFDAVCGLTVKPALKVWAPLPTLRQQALGFGGRNDPTQTKVLQRTCNFWGWRDAFGRQLVVDGNFGNLTGQAVARMQRSLKVLDDEVYGPRSQVALQRFLDTMSALAARR